MTPTADQPDKFLTFRDEQRVDRLTASSRQALVKFRDRPNPPRGVKFTGVVLQWEPPVDSAQVTHYRVYADTETNLVREVPAGQLQMDGLFADRAFVSAINKNSGLESVKVLLAQQIAPTFEEVVITNGVFTNDLTPDSIFISSADGGLFQVETTKTGPSYTTDMELLNPAGPLMLFKNQSIGSDELLIQLQNGPRAIVQRVTGATTELIISNGVSTLSLTPALISGVGLTLSAGVSAEILQIVATNLAQISALVRDANGVTTNSALQLQTFAGAIYFKIAGGTDAVAPGAVFTRDIIPLTANLYRLGTITNEWNEVRSQFIYSTTLISGATISASANLSCESFHIISTNTGQISALLTDANGVTTNDALHLQTFGGTAYFRVAGGTDAATPGAVFTRNHVPLVSNLYSLGSAALNWNAGWINTVVIQTLLDLTGSTVTAPSGASGVTFGPSAIATLTVSGGIVVGHT